MSATKGQQKQTSGNKPDADIDFSINSEDITAFALSVPNESSENEAASSSKKNNNTKKQNPKGTAEKKSKDNAKNEAKSDANGNSKTKTEAPKFKLTKLPYRIHAVPDGLPVVEYTISPSKVTSFSGGGHYLSTFYRSQFEMNGVRYQSVEHYYQATKLYALCGHEVAAKIQFVREPFKAKQTAKELLRRYRIPPQAIDAWKRTDGIVTLIYAVALKFIQNRELREKLLKTGDSLIVQNHGGDNFFASAMNHEEFMQWVSEHSGQVLKLPYSINEFTIKHFPLMGKGQNLLGVITMKIRSELATVSVADLYNRDTVNRILQKLSN